VLPEIRFHDLRHTYATLLLARGVHPTYVQRALGHASVKMTLDRYSHWMPSMGRNTADGMEEVWGEDGFAKLALGCVTYQLLVAR
jgi:integrase